jgi:hypothetical protein
LVSETFSSWEQLENGLELGTFHSSHYPDSIKAFIKILRIDPDFFDLRLFCASAPDQGNLLSAKQWCKKETLVAAINASMYQTDYKTSVSLMRTSTHINNRGLSRDKTILAFNPQVATLPRVKIIDRECEDFDFWKTKYTTFIQNIRMISCEGKNVWSQGAQAWSIAALGTDTKGRILFILSIAPHTVHDFNNVLLKLPVGLDRTIYLEGAHVAQMVILSKSYSQEFIGEYTGMGYSPEDAPAIPNVIGVVRRENSNRKKILQ